MDTKTKLTRALNALSAMSDCRSDETETHVVLRVDRKQLGQVLFDLADVAQELDREIAGSGIAAVEIEHHRTAFAMLGYLIHGQHYGPSDSIGPEPTWRDCQHPSCTTARTVMAEASGLKVTR